MTRINAGIHPAELPDALLLAEHREIKRIPNAVAASRAVLSGCTPSEFTLGTGHVRFFYTRLGYLLRRYAAIHDECKRRGLKVQSYHAVWGEIPRMIQLDWTPTAAARETVIARIRSKGFQLLPPPTDREIDHDI